MVPSLSPRGPWLLLLALPACSVPDFGGQEGAEFEADADTDSDTDSDTDTDTDTDTDSDTDVEPTGWEGQQLFEVRDGSGASLCHVEALTTGVPSAETCSGCTWVLDLRITPVATEEGAGECAAWTEVVHLPVGYWADEGILELMPVDGEPVVAGASISGQVLTYDSGEQPVSGEADQVWQLTGEASLSY